jgi:hypothetical protein
MPRKPAKRKQLANIGYGKTIASVLGGAITTIAVFVAQQEMGHPLPAEVSGALQTIITTLAVYFTHHTISVKL